MPISLRKSLRSAAFAVWTQPRRLWAHVEGAWIHFTSICCLQVGDGLLRVAWGREIARTRLGEALEGIGHMI